MLRVIKESAFHWRSNGLDSSLLKSGNLYQLKSDGVGGIEQCGNLWF